MEKILKRLIIQADDYFEKSGGTDILLSKVKRVFGLPALECDWK